MNKKLISLYLIVLVGQLLYAGRMELLSSTEQSAILRTGSIYHRLSIRQINGDTLVVDTLFYYEPPQSNLDYDYYLAGYQGAGDTCINRFTLLAPGKVTKLMMQNSSTGSAQWQLWVPAIEGMKYQFPGDPGVSPLLPVSIPPHFCRKLETNQQKMDSLVWNTYDLEQQGAAVVFDASQLDFWAGYRLDSEGNPKIYQDGALHYPWLDGSCRSYSTLNSTEPGKWFSSQQAGTGNWAAHMMQIEVVYQSIPPIISKLPDLSDTFTRNRTIWAEVMELEGDAFDVFLTVKSGQFGIPDTMPMSYDDENYFWANLDYEYGDTLYYYVWAEDSEGMKQSSLIKSFICVEPPRDTHLLLIDDSAYNSGVLYENALTAIDSSYLYWNMKQHQGIDTTVIYYRDFQTLIILDGENMILPVTDIVDQDYYGISGFLESGGNLLLVDMDYLYRWDFIGAGRFEAGDFAYDYLGIEDFIADPDEDFSLPGGSADTLMLSLAGNPVTSDFGADSIAYGPIRYSIGDSAVENWADYIEPSSSAAGLFQGVGSESGLGICLDGGYFRTATFSLPIEWAAGNIDFISLLDSLVSWLSENTTRLDSIDVTETKATPGNKLSTFRLYDNYPNPFNPTTTITFDIQNKDRVELIIFNLMGETVAKLLARELIPGHYMVDWTARTAKGNDLASGVYFYQLRTTSGVLTKKMVLLR